VALQTMEHVELGSGAFMARITACHVTTYYHVGCAYMALGRWPDAIKTFVSVLIFFVRMKQYHTRSYQYGSVRINILPKSIVTDGRSRNNASECTL